MNLKTNWWISGSNAVKLNIYKSIFITSYIQNFVTINYLFRFIISTLQCISRIKKERNMKEKKRKTERKQKHKHATTDAVTEPHLVKV